MNENLTLSEGIGFTLLLLALSLLSCVLILVLDALANRLTLALQRGYNMLLKLAFPDNNGNTDFDLRIALKEVLKKFLTGLLSQIKSAAILEVLVLIIQTVFAFCPVMGIMAFEGTLAFETLLTFKTIAAFFANGPFLYLGEVSVLWFSGEMSLIIGISIVYAGYLLLGRLFGRDFCMRLPFVKAAYDKNRKSIILGLIMLVAMICIFKVEDRSKTSGKL